MDIRKVIVSGSLTHRTTSTNKHVEECDYFKLANLFELRQTCVKIVRTQSRYRLSISTIKKEISKLVSSVQVRKNVPALQAFMGMRREQGEEDIVKAD